MTIKAVIWDFGGVLTTSPFEAFNRYERQNRIPTDFIRTVNSTNPDSNAWAQFESNAINLKEFDSLFLAETSDHGYPIKGTDVVALLAGEIRPRMVSVLQKCKTTLVVACITNNLQSGHGPSMAKSISHEKEMSEVMNLFDLVVESSKEGIRKPNPKIYELTCERLGIYPNEAVFLDDLGINLKPARKLGMQTIKVIDVETAILELTDATGIMF